jgi:ATPase subunit of ABC transporter with duplicated ATPase domains
MDRADFLLLDEPTNHLDRDGREALYAFVAGWTGGLLCASHDRELLGRMDRIAALSADGLRVYGGGWDAYVAETEAEEAAAAEALDSARAALRRARREAAEMVERQRKREARGRASAATANAPKILLGARRNRAEGTRGRVGETAERLVSEGRARMEEARRRVDERARLAPVVAPSGLGAGKLVAEMTDVRWAPPGAEAAVLDGVSLRIVGPERVSVSGPNGSGKTSLLRLLAGRAAADGGRVRVGVPADRVSYLSQHADAVGADETVAEAFRRARPEMEESERRAVLARFLFPGADAEKRGGVLSGGERLRAALACTLGAARPPQLLLLDEPTNHLDLDSVAALEAALGEYDGALVVVSHDVAFLRAVGVGRDLSLGRRGGDAGAFARAARGA